MRQGLVVIALAVGVAVGFAAGGPLGSMPASTVVVGWRERPPRFTPLGCPDARLVALSPDGLHRIDFVVTERPLFAMPGGGSDVGGHLVLVSRDTDEVLGRSGFVPLLSGISPTDVRWTEDCVELTVAGEDAPGFLRWPLGRRHPGGCGDP